MSNVNHCLATEQCVDDVYCNCPCDLCSVSLCFRPGCLCRKIHIPSYPLDAVTTQWFGVVTRLMERLGDEVRRRLKDEP